MKKSISLLLALLMMISIIALPAAASADDPCELGHDYVYVDNNDSTSCTDYGTATGTCTRCGDTVIAKGSYKNCLPHEYGEFVLYKVEPCRTGIHYISCCTNENCGSYLLQIKGEPTGKHEDDGTCHCKMCGIYIPDVCEDICHKDGVIGILYKLIKPLWKLFRINPKCSCGLPHYE